MRTIFPFALLLGSLVVTGCARTAQDAAVAAPRDLSAALAERAACVGPAWPGVADQRLPRSHQPEWQAWRHNLAQCHARFTATLDRLLPAYQPHGASEVVERDASALGPYGRGEITFAEMNARSTQITTRYAALFSDLWRHRQAVLFADAQTEAQSNSDAQAGASITLGVLSVAIGAASLAIPAPTPAPAIALIPQ